MTLTILVVTMILLIYHHVFYPLLLKYATFLHRPEHEYPDLHVCDLPSISVIVPVHNESAVIAAKIANICAFDYPPQNLRVVLALDGCTDRTESIARQVLAELSPAFQCELFVYKKNLGKVAALNEQIRRSTSDLVALSDASALVNSGALRRAAAHFTRDNVGVVCGTYAIKPSGGMGESAYWRYQTELKAHEGAIAAPMGAHGAFYVIRRALWSPLPVDAINDDFVLPMRIIAEGYDSVYDRTIIATEMERSDEGQNFWRRVRIGAGNIQQAVWLLRLADPRRPRLAFLFLSGKGLRAFVPILLLAMGGAALYLASANPPVFIVLLSLGASSALLAAIESGAVAIALPRRLHTVGYIVQGYAALSLGTLFWLTGLKHRAWKLSLQAKNRTIHMAPARSVRRDHA